MCSGEDQLGAILDALSDVSKWQEIGLLLGISYMKLQMIEIEEDNVTIPHKMRAMAELWLGRKYDIETFGKPSWRTLVGVIAAHAGGQFPRLAKEIAAKHPRAGMLLVVYSTAFFSKFLFYLRYYESRTEWGCTSGQSWYVK